MLLKICVFLDILEKYFKNWALNKKYIAEKDFEILRSPVTFNDLLDHTSFNKNLRLHNVSIHINFHQTQVIISVPGRIFLKSRIDEKT